MAKRGTLLIVDDNRNILSAVKLLADGYFAKVVTLNDAALDNIFGAAECAVARYELQCGYKHRQ